MTEQEPTEAEPTRLPHWSEPGWDALPDAVKAAEMQAFLQRVGYDPEKERLKETIRRLEERLSSLEHTVQSLSLQLNRWIAAEQAATKQRIDAQRSQFH